MAEILDNTPDSLRRCAQFLARDEIVAVRTETVYGLAGNALSETAVRRISTSKPALSLIR